MKSIWLLGHQSSILANENVPICNEVRAADFPTVHGILPGRYAVHDEYTD
jgi:hypothetical protein